MMRALKYTSATKGPFGETLLGDKEMLERLPELYPIYEKAVNVVSIMAEHAEFKSKELHERRRKGEVSRIEYRNEIKGLKRRIDNADYRRYHCFVTYLARFFDGSESDLASLMTDNGYTMYSGLYNGSDVKICYLGLLDILDA